MVPWGLQTPEPGSAPHFPGGQPDAWDGQLCNPGLQTLSSPGRVLELRDTSQCLYTIQSREPAHPEAAGSKGGSGSGREAGHRGSRCSCPVCSRLI